MGRRIRPVPFISPAPLGVEVMTAARLRAMAPPGYLERPQRPEFHLLIAVDGGKLTHTVDFEEYALEPGQTLWVRPGQVQLFGILDEARADLVLFQSEFLLAGTQADTLAGDPSGPALYMGTDRVSVDVRRARRDLKREFSAAANSEPVVPESAEILRYLLSVLILRLAECDDGAPHPDSHGTYARFRELLERDFRFAHDTDHYSRRLGYSQRTVARATRDAVDRSPKQLIQERIGLEARRLLAHTDLEVSEIARQLGFSDPSNFSAFFAREASVSPSAFRATQRRQAPGPPKGTRARERRRKAGRPPS